MVVKHSTCKGLIKGCSGCLKSKPIECFSDSRETCDDCRSRVSGKPIEEIRRIRKKYQKRNWTDHLKALDTAKKKANFWPQNGGQIKQSDRYIRNLLCSHTILETNDIPEELVALKRSQMKLKRRILEIQK